MNNNKTNSLVSPSPKYKLAGQLGHYLPFWHSICSDHRVLNLISGVKFEFESPPVQKKFPRQISMTAEETVTMDNKILELLENESITEIPAPPPDGFVSNAFLVKKKCGKKYRFIANLSSLNRFLKKKRFKMSGINSAITLITPNCYMASLDVESSFSHLSISPPFRKYVVFQWRSKPT